MWNNTRNLLLKKGGWLSISVVLKVEWILIKNVDILKFNNSECRTIRKFSGIICQV